MISTDAHQVGFFSSLTIVNETTNFIKTIVLKMTIFKKTIFKKTNLKKRSFRFRFFVVVFLKNENVNIPNCRGSILKIRRLQNPLLILFGTPCSKYLRSSKIKERKDLKFSLDYFKKGLDLKSVLERNCLTRRYINI